ncbi:uncharacterized protein BHQ10_002522 [Talaromyces amestolkiae]|uniref:Fe2OG dioxygenase domain-containing protein n=1 Tax=Talaromyces amestolkiae TaxID=1196081 RepID=A0A364KSH6_TALAM|nr:uncharacterized protein BHQ10_002522 [Talaromyces amestolkiae]RAO66510.1 hypothetical protein BHQ10_002522 [Talaromyces amestolkiae]
MATSFETLPIIDFQALGIPATKSEALEKLKHALFNVGFLYLANTGLEKLIEETHETLPEFFDLPESVKQSCNMLNSPSFLGYTSLGAETTARKTDLREQFDFGTPVTQLWKENDLPWQRLEGPSQFPNKQVERLVTRYTSALSTLSGAFLRAVAECLSLPPNTFETFLGNMHRLKFVRYPRSEPGSQGVGPHKDSTGLFTFLSQDPVGGLEVLNKSGQWISAPYIEGTFVVNVQQGFEAITGGLCPATTHRVIAPTTSTRYSIPFFQAVRLDLTLFFLKEAAADIVRRIPTQNVTNIEHITIPSEFLSPLFSCFGEAQLRNRIISHPDVGRRWYPDLYEKYSQQSLS